MREGRNPSKRRGNRNIFCSEYNHCLDYAINQSWNSWNCCKCQFRFNLVGEGQALSITREEIVEYGLMIQPLSLDYGFYDHEFDSALTDAAVY
jgi:hypothetical protein